MKIKKFLLLSMSYFICTAYTYAAPVMVDVYANVDSSVNTTISGINQTFESSGIYAKYNIKPLILSHKVHLTMYLTQYDDSQITNIERVVEELAKETKPFVVHDSGINLKSSNYLMLDVQNSIPLQILSDQLAVDLMCYRDKNAVIPAWANAYPLKKQMFERYGSPNVFSGFDPHFSIFVAKVAESQQRQFSQEVNSHLKSLKFTPHNYLITSLGIGITDDNGQIVQQIKEYNLNK